MACGPIKSIWHWIRGQKLPSDRGLMSGPLTWALSKSSITFSFLGENNKIFQSLKPVFSVFKTCCRVFFHLLKGKDCLLQTVLVMPRVIWLPHYILSYGHISAFSWVVTTWRGCWLGLQHTLFLLCHHVPWLDTSGKCSVSWINWVWTPRVEGHHKNTILAYFFYKNVKKFPLYSTKFWTL